MSICKIAVVRLAVMSAIFSMAYSYGLCTPFPANAAEAQPTGQSNAHPALPSVRIVINEIPPYSYFLEDGSVTGLWVKQIDELMDAAGLEHNVEIVP